MPAFLKFFMYFIELVIVNILFFFFFNKELTPGSTGLHDLSSIYGFMAMTLSLCYVAAVWIRPISFYYRSSRRGSIWTNVFLATVWMAVFFIAFLLLFDRQRLFSATTFHFLGHNPTLPKLIPFFAALDFVLVCTRMVARWCIQTLRRSGKNVFRVVMVGASDNVIELYKEMENPILGYRVLGYFNDEPLEQAPKHFRYLGSVRDAIPFLHENNVQHLYCALPSAMATEIRQIINCCEHNCIHFFSVPNVRNYLKRTMEFEMLGSVPVLSIREAPLSLLSNRIVKRVLDVIISLAFMVPFWLVIYPVVAIITHITMPGPVFFKQKRHGLNGEEFMLIKFRSMKVNDQADTLQATLNDPRKTPWGNFLRRSSIDELPQFINVLKGDMSIVGPRPHMLKHTEEYSALIDKYMVRHWVRPGITGWAQVTGARGETRELWQMEERIQKDVWYVEHWSIWLDVRIFFMTIFNVFKGDKQAY
ncbi:MAG: undecaprenyl-phosphate glucose phosphotransferase [Bacteroidales bacterium]|nr:undecaprenyl-phosphate glucose phosphotransferase [Bacteroidales bacterium]